MSEPRETGSLTVPDHRGPATVRGGLATMGPETLALKAALERRFLAWAADCDAARMAYPPLMSVSDLHRLDYFQNFPHLAVLGSALRSDSVEDYRTGDLPDVVPAGKLADASYALPSAACYNVYLDLVGRVVPDAYRVTTVATCFRRESDYDELRRLLGFTMREIVCVGRRDVVLEHLASFRKLVGDYLGDLGLPVELKAASDPFFEANGARALMAQLFPVKQEFVFDDSLAIGSLNFHRNFFGERCGIRLADGSPAFTGCVAFGIERWISALTTHFGVGPEGLLERIG